LHEVKFDGYRVQVHIANDAVKIFTRRGNDWTKRFAKIAADAWHLNVKSAIIDGEVIVPGANGVSDFSVLQNELRGKSTKLVLYAFDLLYLNGYDMRKAKLTERKAALQAVVAKSDILFSESFETDGVAMLKSACQMGLEGIVSKVRDSRYQSDRTNDLVKVTCRQRETLSIVGYAMKDSKFDGLYLGAGRAATSCTPGRSITDLLTRAPKTSANGSRRWCRKAKPTPSASRSKQFG